VLYGAGEEHVLSFKRSGQSAMRDAASHSTATPLGVPKGSVITACAAAAVTLAVILLLANPPDAKVFLFTGGWGDEVFCLAMIALVPLTIVV
jgi:hypothetical protein